MSINIEEGRYIILGAVDGLLATLGIIVGVSVVGTNNATVVSAAFGGAIALALTNGLGSYLAESTIEYGKLAATEKSLLRDLSNTYVESLSRRKIIKDALFSGGSSFIGSLIPISPYLLSFGSAFISIGLSLASLIALGIYAGYISKQSYAISVTKMVGLGILIIVAVELLRIGHLVQ